MRASSARPVLGHGIGLRRQHFAHVLEHGVADVDWMEIISENFFEPGGRPWAVLDRVRRDVPVVMHGVAMGLGNADGVSPAYLDRLAALIERVEPAWVSDHLCWGAHGGHHAHDLWPLPYTEEALDHCVEQIGRVQDRLQRRLVIENVSSYVAFRESALSEQDFLIQVAERADCQLLLDVNNVYVSARNHGFSAEAYVDAIPAERIAQIHLAGHTDKGRFLLDTHVGPVPEPVWALFRRVIERVGPVSSLVEWDDEVPDYATVRAEARRAATQVREVLGGV
jgi:uncharacterized protein (UPF0276 family)